jgi:DNA-binding FrmR family transcriptional regulator
MAEDKQPPLKRLKRIEGQVRGLRQLVENDRHCGLVRHTPKMGD